MKRLLSIFLIAIMAFSLCGAGSVKSARAAGQKVIVIDAGHQRKANSSTEPIGPGAKQKKAKVTGGASGRVTHLPEYKLNLQVAKKLKKELEKRGYKVIMVRTKHDVNISNAKRAAVANKYKADAFIRIHANSAGSSSVKGALTIAPTSSNKFMSKKNRKKSQNLSKKVLKAMCRATGAKNRGVMYTDTMSGINWCKVPVTIVEMGFMSNPSEDRKMASSSYQKKIVKGIANGIDSFLK
ncbi:MAG: N-acetylmuramoyl-L-alanine amidase [Lachnospiraceae bacterium]|nr:N-acetylmuramoyl-L-alanine amidase [Lachnospiraceae bacterium]